jgi:hypothetical protein
MKKKKRTDMDLLVLFLCVLAFSGTIYIFFFARTTHRLQLPAESDKPVNQSTAAAVPAKIISEPTPGADVSDKQTAKNDKEPAVPQTEKIPGKVHIQMYNKQPFVEEIYEFSPSEKIYATVTFPQLKPGKYNLTANWIDPARRKVNTASHTIDLDHPSGHRVFFWLELMKNGAFTELFTGDEFKKSVYGTWEVEILMDSQPLQIRKFKIHD